MGCLPGRIVRRIYPAVTGDAVTCPEVRAPRRAARTIRPTSTIHGPSGSRHGSCVAPFLRTYNVVGTHERRSSRLAPEVRTAPARGRWSLLRRSWCSASIRGARFPRRRRRRQPRSVGAVRTAGGGSTAAAATAAPTAAVPRRSVRGGGAYYEAAARTAATATAEPVDSAAVARQRRQQRLRTATTVAITAAAAVAWQQRWQPRRQQRVAWQQRWQSRQLRPRQLRPRLLRTHRYYGHGYYGTGYYGHGYYGGYYYYPGWGWGSGGGVGWGDWGWGRGWPGWSGRYGASNYAWTYPSDDAQTATTRDSLGPGSELGVPRDRDQPASGGGYADGYDARHRLRLRAPPPCRERGRASSSGS